MEHAERVDDLDLVAARARRLADAPVAVEVGLRASNAIFMEGLVAVRVSSDLSQQTA